ncbi:hypothetical protein EK0264_01385 [Epidermidibacterium keratini]|uniref:Suppressor of fused domain protein n=1 Tax=Epidermidibacterium keratini TaxID=1891644 RepID=A0A7L4YHT6_9ACTN|nr:hypothetical protein [Epidermidibacterium keratini]QHB99080.1 hypothetical protein EK0264_01385 [Epidermidibacterium keratini]
MSIERNAKARTKFWSQYGEVSTQAWFGPTNGPMSAWPGMAENHILIRTPTTGIVTTDGLSSPYGRKDFGDELELFIESPELNRPMEQLHDHWMVRALITAAAHIGGQRYRPTFDTYRHTTMRIGNTRAPQGWMLPDENVGALTGVPVSGRPSHIPVGRQKEAILLVPVTPLRPDEIDWVLQTKDREGMAQRLSGSQWGHLADSNRPSLLAG